MADPNPLLSVMRSSFYEGPDMIVRVPAAMESNKLQLLQFLAGSGEPLDAHFNEYLPIVGFLAKRATFRATAEKEARVGFFMGLVLQDGTILQTTSEVVANAIDSFRTVMGEFPHAEPLWVLAQKVKAATAGYSHRLNPIAEDKIPTDAVIFGAS
jgi:hypothetical protein